MEALLVALIIDLEKELFKGVVGKFKLCFLKKTLQHRIKKEIFERYRNEVYYNSFDRFLSENDVICELIRNGLKCTTDLALYKPSGQLKEYYLGRFIEQYPSFSMYRLEMSMLIGKYFDVVFVVLNKYSKDKMRPVCISLKKLSIQSGESIEKITEILTDTKKIKNYLLNDAKPCFNEKKYISSLLLMFPRYSQDKYFKRYIYEKGIAGSDVENMNSFDALISNQKIILLGEAGFGKTYESITLLNQICGKYTEIQLVPIYFSLREYGELYNDILSGIKHKIGSYCDGNVENIITELLESNRIIFIFDAMDEVLKKEDRVKFVADANECLAKYFGNYFFFTSRVNRYSKELNIEKEFLLTKLNKELIYKVLRDENIRVDIPESYYDLFSNPFFLFIGISIIKKSSNKTFFNRSQLFEELFRQLYGDMEKNKGVYNTQPITFSDAMHIIGEFSYTSFQKPLYSFGEFDEKLSAIIKDNKSHIIASFITSGVFVITDTVVFSHKLIKEYCAAYYLMKNYPFQNNQSLYARLIVQDEWKEVFVFCSGLCTSMEEQDSYLNFVRSNNIKLYITCVDSKNDLLLNNHAISNAEKCIRILTQMQETYCYILYNYLGKIANRMNPEVPRCNGDCYQNKLIGLFGCLSNDGNQLAYWFDFVDEREGVVHCFSDDELKKQYLNYEKNVQSQCRTMRFYSQNLTLGNRQGDSGRKIAVDLIRGELSRLIKEKALIESNYLLCERIKSFKSKIKELKDVVELKEIREFAVEKITKAKAISPNIVGCLYGKGIDLFDLQNILEMIEGDVKLEEFILPERDVTDIRGMSCWVWDLYSKEQKKKYICLYFLYQEISYMEMVEKNFPELCYQFNQCKDFPYKMVAEVDFKEEVEETGFCSKDPRVRYYHLAADSKEDIMPVLIEVNWAQTQTESYDEIFDKIRTSYDSKNRIAARISMASTGFSSMLSSGNMKGLGPLSDCVYELIKSSLEDVFGRLK